MSVYVIVHGGAPNETYTVASTDTAQLIAAAKLLRGSKKAKALFLEVETADIRYAFGGAVPTTAGFGHTLAAGEAIRLANLGALETFQFISKIAGTPATLHITIEF